MNTTNNVNHPKPNQFDDELRQVLAYIKMVTSNGNNWISSLDASNGLLNEYNLYIHWRTIDKILSENKDLVRRKKRGKRWEYTLLSEGDSLVSRPELAAVLINPAQALEAVISLQDTLGSLTGEIRVCDPYLDPVTIEHLNVCPASAPVKLLTCKIRKDAKVRLLLGAAKVAGRDIEVRQRTQGDIHDRYIIDNESMFHLGTSLNGFAKKQHFIIKLGEDTRRLTLADFDSRWANSPQWP